MDLFAKLALLSENMDVEDGDYASISNTPVCSSVKKSTNEPNITYARLPNGGSIPLLKTMITSVCEKNCNYCAFRAGRDTKRTSFLPDEMAETFIKLKDKGVAKGLFLSSGIFRGDVSVQDKIIDTAEILRKKRGFKGYLHLKIMPGAEYDQIKRLMLFADRVSINLEAPNPERLGKLAPKKEFFDELFTRLRWIEQIRQTFDPFESWNHKWPSISTQFVVGPAGENDREIINTSAYLFRKLHLARVYFMTFNPVRNTPLENTPKEDPLRGHRLYQASYLLRDYGYQFEELIFDSKGNLSLERDPKMIWADQYLQNDPVEINFASFRELIRIPGIGSKRAKMICHYRKNKKILDLSDLQALNIPINRAGPYILMNGKSVTHQLSLF